MLIRHTDRSDVVNNIAFTGALNVPSYVYVCTGGGTINSKSTDLNTHMEKQLLETYQIEPIQLQHINTLAVNPYLPTCNLYACRCIHSFSEQCWNADSTEI